MRMHPIRLAIALVLVALHGGCIPLRQAEFARTDGMRSFPSLGGYDGYFLVQAHQANEPNPYRIVVTETYAIAPDGRRHAVETEVHAYDAVPRHPGILGIRERLYILDGKGRRIKQLSHGDWKVLLTLDGPMGRRSWEYAATVSTFLYVPMLHGPPN